MSSKRVLTLKMPPGYVHPKQRLPDYTIPYTKEEIAKCSLDENGNVIDPVTLEPVDPKRLIIVPEGKAVYCFDVETLQKNKTKTGYLNPYTNQPIPGEIVQKIINFEKSLEMAFWIMLPDFSSHKIITRSNEDLGKFIFSVIPLYIHRIEDASSYEIIDENEMKLLDENLSENTVGQRFRDVPNTLIVFPVTNRVRKEQIREKLLNYAIDSNRNEATGNLTTPIILLPREIQGNRRPISDNQLVGLMHNLREIESPNLYLLDLYHRYEPHFSLAARQAQKAISMIPSDFPSIVKNYISHVFLSMVSDKSKLSSTDRLERLYASIPVDVRYYQFSDVIVYNQIMHYMYGENQ